MRKQFTLLAALLISLCSLATPPSSTITFKSTPFNTYWMKGESDSEFYLYVHLEGMNYTAAEEVRAPYNLSLVIDKSGSMGGTKIAYAKQALNYVIDQLSERDVISLVEYSDGVLTRNEPISVTNKAALHAKVNEIYASGSTNLSGGMTRGFELVESAAKFAASEGNYVHRVMLLSDGLANAGVTSQAGICDIVRKYSEKNYTISTFGVGADYNETLMAAIANAGGGRYHFIQSPEEMPKIFEEELNGISNLVAKDVHLEIEYPADKVSFKSVGLYPSINNNGKLDIRLSDLFSEEQKVVLIKFDVKDGIGGDIDFKTGLRYFNPMEEGKEVFELHEHSVMQTESKSEYKTGYSKDANMGYALLEGGAKFDAAMEAGDKRNFKEAERLLQEAKQIMEDHFTKFKPHPFLRGYYDEMIEYEGTLEKLQKTTDRTTYNVIQKSSKHRSHTRKCRAMF